MVAGIAEFSWLLSRDGYRSKRLARRMARPSNAGDVVLEIEGRRGDLLAHERVGLNLLQRMSGIATATRYFQELRASRKIPRHIVVGTRKTPWGLLDKRAVHLGGGGTHRLGLWDAILVKNNHLALLAEREEDAARIAVERAWPARKSAASSRWKCEAKQAALRGGRSVSAHAGMPQAEEDGDCPCLLLLDNMPPAKIAAVIADLRTQGLLDHVLIEASGNISESNHRRVRRQRRGRDLHGRVDAFGARTRSLSETLDPKRKKPMNPAAVSSEPFEARYTLPSIEEMTDTADEILAKQERIRELCQERNAIILAHHYERPEVQEVADYVADSLRLSQSAAATDADVIVFCGVHFMAETAAILCPAKTVLLPDLRAGCSLAAAITADELRAWKARFPDAVVVAYINTSAEVKAESDYCCTSANAAKVVRAIPAERPILFIPDKFLAQVVARQAERSNIIAYPGYLPRAQHDSAGGRDEVLEEHPDVELLLHPGVRLRQFVHGQGAGRQPALQPHVLPFHRRNAAAHRRIARARSSPWERKWEFCTG